MGMRERRTREGKLKEAVLWEMQRRAAAKHKSKAVEDKPRATRGRKKCESADGRKKARDSSPVRTRKRAETVVAETPSKIRRKSSVGVEKRTKAGTMPLSNWFWNSRPAAKR